MSGADRAAWAVLGSERAAFERPLAVSSLQAGLYAALRAAGAGPGRRVLCDPLFPFAALAVLHARAEPVFPRLTERVVPSPEAWQDVAAGDVAAVIATRVFDVEPDLTGLEQRGVRILDCALGPFAGASMPPWDVLGVSFARGKPLSSGEGGLLIFADPGLHERTLRWCRFGCGDEERGVELRPPGLNLRLSPALIAPLRASRARLGSIRGHLEAARAELARDPRFQGEDLGSAGSDGWYRALLLPPGRTAEAMPPVADAGGLRFKRLILREVGAALGGEAPRGAREAAEAIARRLVWYRPELPDPWEIEA